MIRSKFRMNKRLKNEHYSESSAFSRHARAACEQISLSSADKDQSADAGQGHRSVPVVVHPALQAPARCLVQLGHIHAKPGHGRPGPVRVSAFPVLIDSPAFQIVLAKDFFAGIAGKSLGGGKTIPFCRQFQPGGCFVQELKQLVALAGIQDLGRDLDPEEHGPGQTFQLFPQKLRAGHMRRAAFG